MHRGLTAFFRFIPGFCKREAIARKKGQIY